MICGKVIIGFCGLYHSYLICYAYLNSSHSTGFFIHVKPNQHFHCNTPFSNCISNSGFFFLVCNQFVKCPSHHKTNKNNYVFIFTNLLSTPALLKILFHLFCFVENKIHLISFEYNLLIEKQPLFIKCSLVAH